MLLDSLVEIPDVPGKIVRKTVKGTVYIDYEYDRVYDSERKYNIPKRTTIGKLADDGRMHPNANYMRYFPHLPPPEISGGTGRSSCLRVGAHIVIDCVVRHYGLEAMLGGMFGGEAGFLLDLASYSIICEDNAGQYYPDWAWAHPLFTPGMRVYSDSKVSTFLHSITHGHTSSFLNEWNRGRNHRERIYISYDSTNKHSQAGEIAIVEPGHAKDGGEGPVFNYSLAHDVGEGEPLFYEEYPGSVVDVSQLEYMVGTAASYGYKNVGFIIDRGYFSKANIRYMDAMGFHFVIMVKGMAELVSSLIEAHKGSFERSRPCSIRTWRVYAKTVVAKLYADDEHERYLHLYYSSAKDSAEREELEADVERMGRLIKAREGQKATFPKSFRDCYEFFYAKDDETLLFAREREGEIERRLGLCGYFVLVTSAAMDAREALDLYKSRDQGEKLFRGDKSYLGNRTLRVQSSESASGKIFVEFVALIIRSRIYRLLKEEMEGLPSRPNYMTVPAAVKELEKIEMVRGMDGLYRLDHAVTKRQKSILNAFGLDEEDVRRKAIELAQRLAKGE